MKGLVISKFSTKTALQAQCFPPEKSTHYKTASSMYYNSQMIFSTKTDSIGTPVITSFLTFAKKARAPQNINLAQNGKLITYASGWFSFFAIYFSDFLSFCSSFSSSCLFFSAILTHPHVVLSCSSVWRPQLKGHSIPIAISTTSGALIALVLWYFLIQSSI